MSRWRRFNVRARLGFAELRDWSQEQQLLWRLQARSHLEMLQRLRSLPAPQLLDLLWDSMASANRRFDDRFNAAFDRTVDVVVKTAKELQEKGLTEMWRQSCRTVKPQRETKVPVDTGVLALIGVGVASASHGFCLYGIFFCIWAILRSARRFLVICLDTEDADRLFKFFPKSLQTRKSEVFNWLHHELNVMRQIRAGNLHYIGRPGDKDWDTVHNPQNDHNPGTLFDLAMEALSVHPRVNEWVGDTVRAKAEPDKVVYRMHEGIAETFLGWYVKGELGEAEVQVKSIGSIVDFIYIFPQGRDHYGLQPPGFVIRPNGDTWSQDEDDLPNDAKQPFGKHGRTIFEREGIFDWDYEVGAWHHGLEPERRKRRKRWFQ